MRLMEEGKKVKGGVNDCPTTPRPCGDPKGQGGKKLVKMAFEQHISYDVRKLSLREKKKLLEKAFKLKYNWWVDKLDCKESIARQKIDMSFEEIMSYLAKTAYVTLIQRKERWPDPEHLEMGFCSMGNPVEYFLWIQVPLSEKDKFKKYMKVMR